MKMLLITSVFPPQTGGSGRWFWEIYRRLPREQVVIVAGEHPRQAEFDRSHDLTVVRMRLSLPTWGTFNPRGFCGYAGRYRAIRRVLKQHRIAQVHCGTLLPEGWIAWLLKRTTGLGYLCYVHGEELNIGAHSRELGWMMRRVLRGAQRIIANSRNTAQLLEHNWHVPADRIAILHPGVDAERFIPAARCPDARRSLGWDDRTVVLTVGRLQKRKGQDQLIRALPAIRRTVPDVLYAIVGEGEERGNLESLVRDRALSHHVRFHGELNDDDLVHCYQQCDLFALPNREVDGDIEGFGMVLLEAQACGKPVIAGASGGTAETLSPGETGLLVHAEDPANLAQTIAPLLEDEPRRRRMGAAGRRWVEDQFEWASLSRRAGELFVGAWPRNP